jgi:hypothetical protein
MLSLVLSHPPEAASALHPSINVVAAGITQIRIKAKETDDRRIYPEICTAA